MLVAGCGINRAPMDARHAQRVAELNARYDALQRRCDADWAKLGAKAAQVRQWLVPVDEQGMPLDPIWPHFRAAFRACAGQPDQVACETAAGRAYVEAEARPYYWADLNWVADGLKGRVRENEGVALALEYDSAARMALMRAALESSAATADRLLTRVRAAERALTRGGAPRIRDVEHAARKLELPDLRALVLAWSPYRASKAAATRSARERAAMYRDTRRNTKVRPGVSPEITNAVRSWLASRAEAELRRKPGRNTKRAAVEIEREVPIDQMTLDHYDEVMRRLPEGLAPRTRHRVAALISRILGLAVYPLRLIPSSPIPRGALPTQNSNKAHAYLYPDEDRRLMACRAVPLVFRLLWGFLAREGMRLGEAIGLTWGDVDLERGAVRLDKNKTDDPRAWALHPGVVVALRAYHETRSKTEPGAPVFTTPAGRALVKYGMARLLRSHLQTIGLEKERPELFTTTAERQRIRVHDLRGTFVTISLANGKSESWISDRIGHRSSQMIANYKRTARTFVELDLGELAPLHEAIPELSTGHELAMGSVADSEPSANLAESFEPSPGIEPGTYGLRNRCSTPELRWRAAIGAVG